MGDDCIVDMRSRGYSQPADPQQHAAGAQLSSRELASRTSLSPSTVLKSGDAMPIEPSEIPPIKPGQPAEPPPEDPPGNPNPEIPPPVSEPGEPQQPR